MQNISLKAKNDGAEKLWSYILAYREMTHRKHETHEKEPQDDWIEFFVPRPLELVKISPNKKRKR